MAQHDYVIDNQTAPAFRTDLNQALQAIVSNNSGGTAPSTTYGNMLWYDSSANILKMRNEADDAWINLGTLDQVSNTFSPSLPFTPVQQGGGAGQGTNKVYIGWGSEGNLKAQVDVTDVGKIYHGSAPGNAPTYACRAWVNFDGGGTVTIRGAGNVSSITDNGTGDYTVNLSIWMPDVSYCVVTTGSNDAGDNTYRNTTNANRSTFATSSFRIFSQGVNQNNSQKEDSGNVNVAVFR